ncbi:MAG: hypothetical protein AAFX94_05265 [Myxococcota bacterium]
MKTLAETPLEHPFVNRGMPIEPKIWTVEIPDDPKKRRLEFADFNPGGGGKPVLAAHGRGQRGPISWSHYAEARLERGERIFAPSFSTHGASSSPRPDVFTQRPQHIESIEDQVGQLHFAIRYVSDLANGGNSLPVVDQSFSGLIAAIYLQGHEGLPKPMAESRVGLGSLAEAYMDLPLPGGFKLPLTYPIARGIVAALKFFGKESTDFAPGDGRAELVGIRSQQVNGGPVQSHDRERASKVIETEIANFLYTTDNPSLGTLEAFFKGRDMALDPKMRGKSSAPQLLIIGEEDYINKPKMTERMADHMGAEKLIIPHALHESMQLLDRPHGIGDQVLDAIDDFYARHHGS